MTDTVQLWIDNDQRLYNDVLDAVRDQGTTDHLRAGDAVKDVVEGFLPPLEGLAQDLVAHALWDVNWVDLGTDYLDLVQDEDGA
jgi:hypothetical protein